MLMKHRHGKDFLCLESLISLRNVLPFRLACRCAKESLARGYSSFGLQFYGECWSDPQADDRFDRYGKSQRCEGFRYKSCNEQDSNECVGTGKENYVYRIIGHGGKEIPQIYH